VRVLPLLSPGVNCWVSGLEGVETKPPEQLARERVHSSTVRTRWVGSITGSSFYVGMPSALAVIYCERNVRRPIDVSRSLSWGLGE
jgi:hypothetical protein